MSEAGRRRTRVGFAGGRLRGGVPRVRQRSGWPRLWQGSGWPRLWQGSGWPPLWQGSGWPRPWQGTRIVVWTVVLVAAASCTADSTDPLGGTYVPDARGTEAAASTVGGPEASATSLAGTEAAGPSGSGAATGGPNAGDSGGTADARTVVGESLSWSPDGTQLAFGTREGRFFVGAGPEWAPVDGAALGPSSRPFARWSPTGDQVLLGGAWFDANQVSTGLWLYTPASGQMEEIVPPSQVVSSVGGNTGAVHDAQWSPDGTRIAFPYRGEAWLAAPGEAPVRLTTLTEAPLPPADGHKPFDGVRYVFWDQGGDRLALELSCDCGVPWSGAAVVGVDGDKPVAGGDIALVHDGMTVSGWSPDGRVLGQNVADWSPAAVVDGYAVGPADGATQNLTQSVEGRDPLAEASASAGPGSSTSGAAGPAGATSDPAAPNTAPIAGLSSPPLYQTGPVQWGPDGTLLYETYSYSDHPVPHRGFAVRRLGALVDERIGSPRNWFTGARLLADGRVAYVETGPGPVMPLLRAMIGDQEVAPLDGLATALSFSPDATRLAVVEGSLTGGGGAVKVIELPVR